jgi:hypothetical protein
VEAAAGGVARSEESDATAAEKRFSQNFCASRTETPSRLLTTAMARAFQS